MSFVLRQVTRRAGGGDIVRQRMIEAAEPVIGRGSDCDIQISDLAVGLRHAVLRDAGRGRVVIEAVGRLTFEVKGSFVGEAELFVGDAPQIVFGNHVLTLSAGEEAGEIVVTAAANDAARETITGADLAAAFSRKRAPFSLRRAAWIGGFGILAVCLALPVGQFFLAQRSEQTIMAALGADKQWSSGPLIEGHRFLETDCQSCHRQAFVSVRDETCLTCHKADLDKPASSRLAIEVRDAGSPVPPSPVRDHAALDRLLKAAPPDPDLRRRIEAWFESNFNHPNNRCVSCHIEHVGPGQTQLAAAVPAATPPTRPVLTSDVLLRNTCQDCHAALKERLPDSKLSNTPSWDKHPDFRTLVTVAVTASPAGAVPRIESFPIAAHPPENTGLTFSHREHLLDTGSVARMARELGRTKGYGTALVCANCHAAEGGSFKPIEMERDCAACHSLDYARVNGVLKTLPHGKPDEVVAALRAIYAEGNSTGPDLRGAFVWRPGFGPLGSANPQTIPQGSAGARVANGVRTAFTRGGTCYGCHTIVAPKSPVSLAFDIAPVKLPARFLGYNAYDHSVKEHREKAGGQTLCADCHEAAKSEKSADLLMPSITECASCHGKTKPEVPAAASADCAECHSYHYTARPGVLPPRKIAQN